MEFLIRNVKNTWTKKIKSECDLIGFNNNRLNYRCKKCRKICPKSINEAVKDFPTTYRFCKGDLNKFVLLLRKSVYPYEYMDSLMKLHYQIKKLFTANQI